MLEEIPLANITKPHPYAEAQELIFNGCPDVFTAASPDFIRNILGPDYSAVVALFKLHDSNREVLRHGINLMRFRLLLSLHMDQAETVEDFDKNSDTLIMEIERLRFYLEKGALIETTHILDRALDETDIGPEIPSAYFTLPYDHIYIRFGEGRSGISMQFPDRGSNRYCIDGAYLRNMPGKSDARSILIHLTFRHVGVHRDLSRFTSRLTLKFTHDEQSVAESLENMMHEDTSKSVSVGQWQIDSLKAAIGHLAKSLLYINTKDSIAKKELPHSEMVAKMKNLGTKKMSKMTDKLSRLFDRIVIGPTVVSQTASQNCEREKNNPHWRRGHFRNQVHGAGRQERKLIWIKPTLINGEEIVAHAPSVKSYVAVL